METLLASKEFIEYQMMGLSQEDIQRFMAAGFTPDMIRPFVIDPKPLLDNIGSPTPVYNSLPTPKRPKRKLTVDRLLNG